MATEELSDIMDMDSMDHEDTGGDEDNIDDTAHEKLLNSLFALDGKKRAKDDVRGISAHTGNLDLAVHAKKDESKIQREDLKLKARRTPLELKRPMSTLETELAKRHVARDTMVKDMTTWEPVVQEIRSASQTIYSNTPHGVEMREAMKPKAFTPRTALEKELFAALGQSEDVLHPNKELTIAEEKALRAMSVHEAMARRAELLKHNELLSRAQVRAKRVGKIKSKRYRKILRKEKESADRKELERLQTSDPAAFVERLEQLERDRMEERHTLKHRGGGKFARLHKVYSKFDDKTRDAMQDMLQKSRELTKKTEAVSSSEEEEEADITSHDNTGNIMAVDNEDDEDDEDAATKTSAASVQAARLEMLKAINKKAGGWLDGPKSTFVYADEEKMLNSDDLEDSKLDKIHDEPLEENNTVSSLSTSENLVQGDAKSDENKSLGDLKSSLSVKSEKETVKRKAEDMEGDEEVSGKVSEEEKTEQSEQQKNKRQKRGKKKSGDSSTEGNLVLKKGNIKKKDVEDEEDISETESDKEMDKTEESEQPKKKKRNRRKRKNREAESAAGEDLSSSSKVKPVVETTLDAVPNTEGGSEDNDDNEGGDDNLLKVSMEELFQDEDVVEEFAREKAAAEAALRPKIEDTRLPGWGSWAGPDYKAGARPLTKKQRREQARAQLIEKQRQKIQQPHVWLNPNKDDSIRKLQPKNVPFPYNSVQQFEASMRQPVSRGFVRETAFKLLNKPEVVTKLGHIIAPLDKDSVFKKQGNNELTPGSSVVEVKGGAMAKRELLKTRGSGEKSGGSKAKSGADTAHAGANPKVGSGASVKKVVTKSKKEEVVKVVSEGSLNSMVKSKKDKQKRRGIN